MKKVIKYQNEIMEYEFTPKKVKNINMRLKMDKTLLVSAHPGVPFENVESFIISKWVWIRQAQVRLEKLKQIQSEPEQCDSLRLFGKVYPIHLEKGSMRFKVNEDHVYVSYPDISNQEKIKVFIMNECVKLLKRYIEVKCQDFDEILKEYRIEKPEIVFRKMKGKWGSCLVNKNKITLNTNLLYYPKSCSDYVLLHEYAHLIVPNHSKRFYQVVSYYMPNYKEQEKMLMMKG